MMTDDSKTTGLVREVSQRLTISARDTPTILDRRSLLKGLAVGATAALGGSFLKSKTAWAQAENAELQEYKVNWSAEQLEALKNKISSYKFPQPIPGSK
jgi:hypothetical protein